MCIRDRAATAPTMITVFCGMIDFFLFRFLLRFFRIFAILTLTLCCLLYTSFYGKQDHSVHDIQGAVPFLHKDRCV